MTWAAKLLNATKDGGVLLASVEYTDGTTVRQKGHHVVPATETALRREVRAEVARLDAAATETITTAEGAAIDLTPEVVLPTPTPKPTQAELDAAAWFDRYGKLQALQRLANHGLILPTDTRITTLQTRLKADWLNAYLDRV